MQLTAAELASRFSLPGLQFQEANGHLLKAVIETAGCRGEMYAHGAHVTHFQPAGEQPVLWMSHKSAFDAAKPIRGGVPICFPWFGPHATDAQAPAHGWARLQNWEFQAAEAVSNEAIALTLVNSSDDFELVYRVEFGSRLSLALQVRRAPQAAAPARFEEALHTYLSVSDVHKIWIAGLESAEYIDKVAGGARRTASQEPLRIDAECDRVYLNTASTCTVHDPSMGRDIRISKSGSLCSVVWNPWIEKSARMADFGDNEWPGMLCVESANVGPHAVELQPGDRHTLTTQIEIVR